MTVGGAFLRSAKSRLLPASIPFRFFATAAALHVMLWVALIFASREFTSFRGGVGSSLAAVHLLTVGVLLMTAIGAAVQLLPVASARPLAAVWPIRAVYWLLASGAIALVAGMYSAHMNLMIGGAVVSAVALFLFAGLFADNLRWAGGMPIVRAYGWAALVSLILLIALGLALSFDGVNGFLDDHAAAALAHMILGVFGVMGMLALGFSNVLIPMFALSNAPEARISMAGFALAVMTVALAVVGALRRSDSALTAACAVGLVAALLHVYLMQVVLSTGMRKRLGRSFVLVRVSWAMLTLTPVLGFAALQGWIGPGGPTLFGLVSLGGWLMTFLFGILQRIVPFLASMHVTRSSGGPPLLSELGASWPLTLHGSCHFVALAGLTAAIVLDSPMMVVVAASVGLAGALAFATFVVGVLKIVVSGKTTS